MKKLVVVAVCIAVCGLSFGQSAHFGLKAGVNIATFHSSNGTDYSSIASFNGGGLVHIHLSKYLAVQPEIFYSGQGAEYGDVKARLGYLNIPVLVQLMVANGFRLQTGPQLGLLLSAKNKTGHIETDVKDAYNTAEFAWVLGAGYQFPGTGVGIDARYNLGISRLNEIEGPNNIKNRVIAIGLFYQFQK